MQEIQERIDALMQIYQVGKPFVPYIKAAMQEEGDLTTPKGIIPVPGGDRGGPCTDPEYFTGRASGRKISFFSFRMHNRQLQSAKNRSNIMK